MSEIDIIQLLNIRAETTAFMHFPGDSEEDKTNRYYLETHLHLDDLIKFNKSNKIVPVEIGLLESLKELTPWEGFEPIANKAKEEGLIVGEILLSIFLMNKAGEEKLSKRKGRDWVAHIASKALYSDGHPLNTSETIYEEYWGKYKNAAHLWAVCALDGHIRFVPDERDPFSIDRDPPSLDTAIKAWGYAKTFSDFLTNFYPYRRKNLLVDKNSVWRVPDSIESCAIDCIAPEAMLDWLKSYSPR